MLSVIRILIFLSWYPFGVVTKRVSQFTSTLSYLFNIFHFTLKNLHYHYKFYCTNFLQRLGTLGIRRLF